LDEGIDVWRPVKAKRDLTGNTYLILEEEMPEDENWEFPPGSRVKVKQRVLDNRLVLVADELA
jgi:hypothetical protein